MLVRQPETDRHGAEPAEKYDNAVLRTGSAYDTAAIVHLTDY